MISGIRRCGSDATKGPTKATAVSSASVSKPNPDISASFRGSEKHCHRMIVFAVPELTNNPAKDMSYGSDAPYARDEFAGIPSTSPDGNQSYCSTCELSVTAQPRLGKCTYLPSWGH
nr:hypothetical protein MFLOJ_03630 [Mycobacterium florentinum]